MNRYRLIWILGAIMLFNLSCTRNPIDREPQETRVRELMMKVADWQLANLPDTIVKANGGKEIVTGTSWHRAAFLTGVMALYEYTGESKYLIAALNMASENRWEPGPRLRHADDHCIVQTYAELFMIHRNGYMLEPSVQIFDSITANPVYGPVSGWTKDLNWSWCDALFMAPPAYAMLSSATGNPAYLHAMDTLWWLTSDYLYDKEEHLFYRDAEYKINPDGTGPRSANGNKIFWGRGNGWVMGGLVRVLDYMPLDFPDRNRYVDQFREMAERIAELQGKDGLWRSSLLDPEAYPAPETSCSAFFCYAIAWGINQGILDRETYKPFAFRAWNGLEQCIEKDGKLGWVQLVGHDPTTVSRDDTMEYGVGALLLAGKEMVKLVKYHAL